MHNALSVLECSQDFGVAPRGLEQNLKIRSLMKNPLKRVFKNRELKKGSATPSLLSLNRYLQGKESQSSFQVACGNYD